MKTIIFILITLSLHSSSVFATQWKYISLEDLVGGADLVVIGSIDSKEGCNIPKEDIKPASLRCIWNSKLNITEFLKNKTDPTQIEIQWDEIDISGVKPYEIGEKRIFILKWDSNHKRYTTQGRPDTVLLISEKEKVTKARMNHPAASSEVSKPNSLRGTAASSEELSLLRLKASYRVKGWNLLLSNWQQNIMNKWQK